MHKALSLLLLIAATTACQPLRTLESFRVSPPDSGAVALDLYLIGDAGLPDKDGEPVLNALAGMLAQDPDRSFVVYLGDNVYPQGVPPSGDGYRKEAERILDAQIEVLRSTGSRGVMVPGNHDWSASGPAGLPTVKRQEEYVTANAGAHLLYLPSGGCPGPEVLDIGEVLRLIVLDTQWWLHSFDKPYGSDSPCAADFPEDVTAALSEMVRDARERTVVVVAHHPLETGGEHGDYFDWPSYQALPLSLIRRSGFVNQDLGSPEYERMRRAIERALELRPPLVYAAGHEHNLQVLDGPGARYHLVTGAGIYGHITPVRVIPRSRYAKDASGFMRLSLLRDGRARLSVIVVDENGAPTEDFSIFLTGGEQR